MKRTLWMLGLLLAGTLATQAADVRFFRITGPTSTVITALSADGTITWTNNGVGLTYRVESASSADPGTTWERYTEVVATSKIFRQRIFDPNPPAGMVFIPAGLFVMGTAEDMDLFRHTVNISAFYMDKHEVTKALWDEVKAHNGGNGYTYSNTGLGVAGNHPVCEVNWFDAVKWCNARSQRDGLTPVYYTDAGFTTVYKTGEIAPFANWAANGYRLPTEAEWEKAARGGAANTRFPWTDFADNISFDKANYFARRNIYSYDLSGNSLPLIGPSGVFHPDFYGDGTSPPFTSPVGYFAPNGYGLYDVAGNVQEWCWDWYDGTYYFSSPSIDPRGPVGPGVSGRVMRGGSFGAFAEYVRVASRSPTPHEWARDDYGFRCARGL